MTRERESPNLRLVPVRRSSDDIREKWRLYDAEWRGLTRGSRPEIAESPGSNPPRQSIRARVPNTPLAKILAVIAATASLLGACHEALSAFGVLK